jgi:peptide chain release factor 1
MDATETKIRTEYSSLAERMTNPALFGTPEMVSLAKRQAELTPLVELYDQRAKLTEHLDQSRSLVNDPEMGELAREEIPELEAQIETVAEKLRLALVPKDPADAKNAIVEIRAGAGGDEASLFAGELYRLYARYIETRPGWRIELVSESPSEVGGYKEIIFEVMGDEAYGWLK